jgi:hypothetical protein
VGYDGGAASPFEIVKAIGADVQIVFVVDPHAKADTLLTKLSDIADVVPYTTATEVAERLRATGKPCGITSFSESMLQSMSALAAELSLEFHDETTVLRLTNKTLQRQAMRATGIPVPRFCAVKNGEDLLSALAITGYPAVVKPVHGAGSRWTYRIDDPAGAARLVQDEHDVLRSGRSFQVEELLIGRDNAPFGDYISVESVAVDGHFKHLAVTGKFPLVWPFREIGDIWPARILEEEASQALDVTSRALAAVGVRWGLTHTELKLTASGPVIIEVNGRMGGLLEDLAQTAGKPSLIKIAAETALGTSVTIPDYSTQGQVAFNFGNLVPLWAVELKDVKGLGAVRRMRGLRYRRLQHSGAHLSGGVGTEQLDLISGLADNYDSMFKTLKEALSELAFYLTDKDNEVMEVSGLELPSAEFLCSV